MKVTYGQPSSQFIQRHGNIYCAHCRREGNKTPATKIPLGWPKSASFKKANASCDAHLTASMHRATVELEVSYGERDSEADYILSTRFGI